MQRGARRVERRAYPHHSNFSSNSLGLAVSFFLRVISEGTRNAAREMLNINRACSFPAATIIFRNTDPFSNLSPANSLIRPPLLAPSLLFSLSLPRRDAPFPAANLRGDTRRCAKQDFPSRLKGHETYQPLVCYPADPRRPIKSSDGDRTFKTDRSWYDARFYCSKVSLVSFTGPRKLGRSRREKGTTRGRRTLRDAGLRHRGSPAAC